MRLIVVGRTLAEDSPLEHLQSACVTVVVTLWCWCWQARLGGAHVQKKLPAQAIVVRPFQAAAAHSAAASCDGGTDGCGAPDGGA